MMWYDGMMCNVEWCVCAYTQALEQKTEKQQQGALQTLRGQQTQALKQLQANQEEQARAAAR